jgi:hypothetical protein
MERRKEERTTRSSCRVYVRAEQAAEKASVRRARLQSGHKDGKRLGFRGRVRTPFPNSVPQGRLNLAQDASPGLNLKGRPSPVGTAENRPRHNPGEPSTVPAGTQSCFMLYPGLASWAKFNRPCGTKLVNPGFLRRSSAPAKAYRQRKCLSEESPKAQRLKASLVAQLKLCPDTKHQGRDSRKTRAFRRLNLPHAPI